MRRETHETMEQYKHGTTAVKVNKPRLLYGLGPATAASHVTVFKFLLVHHQRYHCSSIYAPRGSCTALRAFRISYEVSQGFVCFIGVVWISDVIIKHAKASFCAQLAALMGSYSGSGHGMRQRHIARPDE
jgi:hypothetical protein